jgi:hypothetical protein
MIKKLATLLGFVVWIYITASAQTAASQCDSKVKFVDKNMIGYTITVAAIQGKAVDVQGVLVSKACIALFANDRSTLLHTVEANDDGEFILKNIKDGDYWLVVRTPGLCPATAHVQLRKSAHKKRITAHMDPGGIDRCSYCEAK